MALTVEYVCTKPEHQTARSGSADLTAHEGVLAYCPSGSYEAHEWQWLGPVPLMGLQASTKKRVRADRAETVTGRGAEIPLGAS